MSLSNNDSSNNPTEYWDNRRDKIVTSIGKWKGGEDVIVRGYSLFNDLFDKVSYFQMVVLNITGRLISKPLSDWLENNFIVMSYPDARIWCNQIAAYSGSLKTSPSAATTAGVLTSDSRIYGGSQSTMVTMKFMQNALEAYKKGTTIKAIIGKLPIKQNLPAVPGFVRPVAKDDERIEPHRQMTKRLGFSRGDYGNLADAISDYMAENYSMGMNIDGFTAGFLLDQGFSPEEVYQMYSLRVASGATACYVDNLRSPENAFLPLKCDDIEYTGPEKRSL